MRNTVNNALPDIPIETMVASPPKQPPSTSRDVGGYITRAQANMCKEDVDRYKRLRSLTRESDIVEFYQVVMDPLRGHCRRMVPVGK